MVSTSPAGRGPIALGLSTGRVVPVEVHFTVTFPEGKRRIEAAVAAADPIVVDAGGRPVRAVAYAATPGGPITAAALGPREIVLVRTRERKALVGPSTKEEPASRSSSPSGRDRALLLDGRGDDLFAGTSTGEVVRLDLRQPSPRVGESVAAGRRPTPRSPRSAS